MGERREDGGAMRLAARKSRVMCDVAKCDRHHANVSIWARGAVARLPE